MSIRRIVCLALVLSVILPGLALGEAPTAIRGQLTIESLEAMGATAYLHDGRVTFVDGACTEAPVRDMEAAAAVVDAILTLLGGDARTQFEPWRELTDASGNRYYVFQQMYAGTTVPGGAVKVVTDVDGAMLGLVASVESELPDIEEAEGITANCAETLVLQHMLDANQAEAELVAGRTELIILPVRRDIDPDDEDDKGESRFVWAVYTTNPGMSLEKGSELPYLAHYVTTDGEYLYNLPTILPGDEASTAGYSAAYVFEFMEPVDYSGTVKLSDGTEQEISLSLMRDTRTGMYYLGNVERRIAVADCYESIYNGGHVVLEASADNTGWDDTCLLSLYNYCRAWDYYHEIGWTGGDGQGTPMLILKDFCTRDHTPMDNAAYAGKYYGWQTFLSSDINDYSQCLDVLAHEFTHCVTGSVMTYNAYMNDYGAINEAMSDIQGNICEMMIGATEDTTWLLGENSTENAIRSMSDPHAFKQPAYAWDIYYVPNVKAPTNINDRGGVHGNSSLLNNVAWRLCENGGMTLEEARAFWFAVDCAMVPGTDHAQVSELMPWVLKTQGMDAHHTALETALDATRLRTDAVPEVFDDDRALVTVTLPEQESFEDGNWMLLIVSVDTDTIIQRVKDILARRGEYAALLDEVAAMLGLDPALLPTEEALSADPDHAWDRFFDEIIRMLDEASEAVSDDAAATEPDMDLEKLVNKLTDLYKRYFSDTVYAGMSAAGQDGHTVRMVCQPGTTVPVLFRLEIDSELNIQSAGLAVYTMGTWIDAGSMVAPIIAEAIKDSGDGAAGEGDDEFSWLDDMLGLGGGDSEDVTPEDAPAWLEDAFGALGGNLGWLKNLLLYRVKPGTINAIPSTGLDKVAVLDVQTWPFLQDLFNDEARQDDDQAGDGVRIDYGASERYTQQDMDGAIALVKAKIAGWDGCALHAVRYAGDDRNSEENIRWLNGLDDGQNYTECIEFLTDFHSPDEGGVLMANREYTDWQWWLARSEGGDWQLVSWGY